MVYIYVRSTLIERIDDTLNHVVEVVSRSLIVEPMDREISDRLRINVEASFPSNNDTVEDDHIDLELFNPEGELLWSTLEEPLKISLRSHPNGKTVQLSPDHLVRQISQPIFVNRQMVGFLRVSHPWFEVTKPTQLLIIDLGIGTGFTILTLAAIGWFLSGIAMEPVKDSYQKLKQFTADASHELRNPIAMIQTNVQVALSNSEGMNDVQTRQLQVVERLTRRLGKLVDDLLFLARQDSGMVQSKFDLVPLDALLIEVIEEQQLKAKEKSLSLSFNIQNSSPVAEEEMFTVSGNWTELARLFTNLISNAIHYTNLGGIQVTLQPISRQGNCYLQVEVKDTGIGIPKQSIPQLCDRFYRLDPARTHNVSYEQNSGSGLGLAIVNAIVLNHLGELNIQSEINQGTTVTVILPKDDD
jgi:OmpR-family two-component system manganese-sensing sensor histidine kinase